MKKEQFFKNHNNFEFDDTIVKRIDQSKIQKGSNKRENPYQNNKIKKEDKYSEDPALIKYNKNNLLTCPSCRKKVSKKLSNKNNISILETADCQNCKKTYVFLMCLHCNREIYKCFENDKDDQNKFRIGINIICPYIDCSRYFTYNICGGCRKFIGIKDKFNEGNPIRCPYDDCQVISSAILCPYIDCEYPNIFQENRYFETFSVRCINSGCKRVFSKFNCNFCLTRFYLDEMNCKNFREGMTIVCPYEDCEKAFNKFYCSFCKRINIIENSIYKVLCDKNFNSFKCAYEDCLNVFIKINCPKCFSIIQFLGNNNLEGKILICDNQECKYSFTFTYCYSCVGLNIWEVNEFKTINKYVRGQNFSCVNVSCSKKISKINCPFCYENKLIIENIENNPTFGRTIICDNVRCKQKFYFYYCPTCKCSKIKKGERKNISELLECPKCNINDNDDNFSVFTKCEKFNFVNCTKCFGNFYYFESDMHGENIFIKCPITNCNQIFYISESCFSSLDKETKEINPNQIKEGRIHEFTNAHLYFDLKCAKDFKRIKTEEIFINDFKEKAKQLNIIYQVPFSNDIGRDNKNDNKEILQECHICTVRKCDIIYAPCGHDYSCLVCYQKLKDSKCPVCQQKIDSVINKKEIE